MTNEEAIRYIIRHCNPDYPKGKTEWETAINMAIEALEKQIPKKPIRIDKNKEFDGNWKKVCPLCGRKLIERITTSEKSFPRYYNYTDHCWCGQAIDWGEKNDD